MRKITLFVELVVALVGLFSLAIMGFGWMGVFVAAAAASGLGVYSAQRMRRGSNSARHDDITDEYDIVDPSDRL